MRMLLWLVLTFNAAFLLSQMGMGPVLNSVVFLGAVTALLFGTLRLTSVKRNAGAVGAPIQESHAHKGA